MWKMVTYQIMGRETVLTFLFIVQSVHMKILYSVCSLLLPVQIHIFMLLIVKCAIPSHFISPRMVKRCQHGYCYCHGSLEPMYNYTTHIFCTCSPKTIYWLLVTLLLMSLHHSLGHPWILTATTLSELFPGFVNDDHQCKSFPSIPENENDCFLVTLHLLISIW